jgi:predicted small lipoprotein YifL
MRRVHQILVAVPRGRVVLAGAVVAAAAAVLAGCGQRGPLYLPTDPAAAGRATLPQVLLPIGSPSIPTPATSTLPTQPAQPATPETTTDGVTTVPTPVQRP